VRQLDHPRARRIELGARLAGLDQWHDRGAQRAAATGRRAEARAHDTDNDRLLRVLSRVRGAEDLGDGRDRVKIIDARLFLLRVALRRDQNQPGGTRFIERRERARTPDRERHRSPRKDDRVAHRQHGQARGDLDRLAADRNAKARLITQLRLQFSNDDRARLRPTPRGSRKPPRPSRDSTGPPLACASRFPLPGWRNWQTRRSQKPVSEMRCWFDSSPGHQFVWASLGFASLRVA
jgi:hypothetical protein